MQERLSAAAEAAAGETTGTLGKDPGSIALADATLSYRDGSGRPLFTVGPITVEFPAGQITMITGGRFRQVDPAAHAHRPDPSRRGSSPRRR